MGETWECIVVGAGAAGLSAALVLGRARRRTLVIDAGGQSNLGAHGIGGLLGRDGRPPAELYAAGRGELAAYPAVRLREGEVVIGERTAEGFCHGWEVRDRPLGVLDRGASGVHRALLLRLWSDDVTLLADGPAGLDDADAERLRAAGITVDERRVTGLRGPGEELTAVAFEGGGERPIEGLLVAVTLHQRSDLGVRLGAVAAERTPLVADAVAVDARYRTDGPGLWAAGDVSAQMQSVAGAIAAGSMAAAMIVQSLLAETHGLAPAGSAHD
jgi:thioredoxin reductase